MSNTQLVKKLGSKQILGNVGKLVAERCENDGDVYKAYTIFGAVNGTKTGNSTFGEWLAFTGTMEAVNHVTGESFAAAQCFVPEPLQSMMLAELKNSDSLEFAFSVSVKRRDDLDRKYEYIVTPITETRQADPLAHLRQLVPQIAPAKQLEIAVESDTEKTPAKGKAK